MASAEPFNPAFKIEQKWDCPDPSHRGHKAKADAERCAEEFAKAAAAKSAAAAAAAAAAPIQQALDEIDATLAKKTADASEDGDKPYGDVKYADPGYQSDGKKRYPIDTEKHIRAAWNYINKPKNAGKYSADQVKSIKGRIVAAWKAKIDKDGPPSADDGKKAAEVAWGKALYDIGDVAMVILRLDALREALELEAAMEGDESPQPTRLQATITELCGFLQALVAEETAELLEGDEVQNRPYVPGTEVGYLYRCAEECQTRMQAAVTVLAGLKPPTALIKQQADFDRFKADLAAAIDAAKAGAKHSARDQVLLDVAYDACVKAAGADGVSEAAVDHLNKAAESFKAAGANATQDTGRNPPTSPPENRAPAAEYHGENATQDTGRNQATSAPQHDPLGTGASTGVDQIKAVLIELAKRGGAQHLMDVAHDCAAKVTDGMTCAAAKVGARHSAETMAHIQAGHDHVTAAGGKCMKAMANNAPPGGPVTGANEATGQGTLMHPGGKAAEIADLIKTAVDEAVQKSVAEKTALEAQLQELGARVAGIQETVKKIAETPLPPQAAAREVVIPAGLMALRKGDDPNVPTTITEEDLLKHLGKMTPEELTMLMIKRSHLSPMRVPGGPPLGYTASGR